MRIGFLSGVIGSYGGEAVPVSKAPGRTPGQALPLLVSAAGSKQAATKR